MPIRWISTRKGRIIAAIVLNAAILAIFLITMVPVFESNDDNALMEMVNGAKGFMDVHMVFINVILGFIYKCFYRLSPNFPWYGMGQLAVMLVGFTAITFVIWERQPNWFGICISLIILTFFPYNCYMLIQFTKTTAVPACGGIMLLIHGMDIEDKPDWKCILAGILISCLGCMFRFNQFLAVTGLLSAIGVFRILRLFGKEKKVFLRKLGTYLIVALLFLGVNLSLRGFDQWVYRHDPEWNAYLEYNIARAQLLDFGFPSYNNNKEAYNELGIDGNALWLYKHWNYYDPDKFSLETIKAIIAMKDPKELSLKTVRGFFSTVPRQIMKYRTIYCVILLFFCWVLWGRHKMPEILAILYQFFCFVGFYFFLYYAGRYLVQRVDTGLFLAMSTFLAFVLTAQKPSSEIPLHSQILVVNLVLLLICHQQWQQSWRVNSGETLRKRQANLLCLRDIAADKDHLYIGKNERISSAYCYGPLDVRPMSELDNRSYFGGWSCNVPGVLQIMENYGVKNPYKDCVGNDKVYLIDDQIKRTIKYIRKYYDPNARAKKIRVVGSYTVYQILTD